MFDPFDVPAAGVEGLRAVIEVQPVEIRGLSVSTSRVCGLDRATGNLIQVWSEARKALSAALLAQAAPGAGFTIEVSEREYTRDLDVIVEAFDTLRASTAYAFGFVPVETLGERGWGRIDDGQVTELYGPSPNVLLSPWFGEHHCLSLEARSTDSRVGLSFASLDRELEVGIEGVFWLRSDTWALDRIDFRFTGSRMLRSAPHQGGEVTLAVSPLGSWYVSSWHVRRPVHRVDLWRLELGRGNVDELRTLIGYAERSGRVLN